MAGAITEETKKEGQRNAKRHTTHKNKKKRKELILLVVGNYFTHNPSIVANMQIMKFNSNGSFRTNITRQHNFPFYNKG
jgi:hypothetical protein